ncbi:MAG: hypothetical protein JRF60_05695 [Deltaproteobacteria bacterium]|nr:hypothetical protein [Deltaproteobacteria bacterium]
MNNVVQINNALDRWKKLSIERREILSLPPEKALERILDAHQPAALVHSIPEEDFYFLIHDIGHHDSLPLLSLASNKQWEYMVDLQVWKKDRLEIESITKWLDLLFKADPARLIKWLIIEKTQFLEFYLLNNIELRIREHDQDPSDFGKGFFTVDDTYYIRVIEDPAEQISDISESDTQPKRFHKEFLVKFLKSIAAYDHVKYQQILHEVLSIIPAEVEEEAFRMRNVRLAEKGFLPFDEAIGIYQPLSPKNLKSRSAKSFIKGEGKELLLPVPFFPADMLKEDNLFTRSLARIESDDILQQIQAEFAFLCNQVITADHKKISDKKELGDIVKKACGYISIGLERITKKERGISSNLRGDHCALFLKKHPLSSVFRVGYGLALKLKWRAEKWLDKCWFTSNGLPLTFWGEEWTGVLGGILIKKPFFFDNYKSGLLYREFVSISDIKETETELDRIIAFDDLISSMSINLKPLSSYRFLSHKNLILTLWARHCLNLPKEPDPLSVDKFKRFHALLFSDKGKTKKIGQPMKESFLKWLAESTNSSDFEISKALGEVFEKLFAEIEIEYGQVSLQDLDPRYIHLFLVEK